MAGIFDEGLMEETLGRYIPQGESLEAGIHAVSRETSIVAVFGRCVYAGDRLRRAENGGTLVLRKKKYAPYDVYLGVTQSCLLIAECEKNKYLYDFDAVSDPEAQPLSADLPLSDVGTCFPLADIQSCEVKKGIMGSVKCTVTMKNGSRFKLLLPKLGGVGGGMPNHAQYRAAILARLSGEETL